jgi:23S rRNA pseudouridine955/2504/2580 synthase
MLASYGYAVKEFYVMPAGSFPSWTIARDDSKRYARNMILTEWQINIRESDHCLLEALRLRVPAAPRALLRQLCKKRRVMVDGDTATAGNMVRAGQKVSVKPSLRWSECLELSRIRPAQILYEDMHCLVIDKPAGLAIHRALGHEDNLVRRVQDFVRMRGETFRVAAVHRLDIGTSGAVLLGKGRASTSQLGKMLMAGHATKHYLALVEGHIHLPGDLSAAVPAKGSHKTARTIFRPVTASDRFTLLELELITGRHHQIRRHLAAAGWPIIGDARYHGRFIGDMSRPFLHCHHLAFQHPATGLIIDIYSPLPGELCSLLEQLQLLYKCGCKQIDKILPQC